MKKLWIFGVLIMLTNCDSSKNDSLKIEEMNWPASPVYWDYKLLQPFPGSDLKGPVKKVHEKIFGAKMKGDKLVKIPKLNFGTCCQNNSILYFDPSGKLVFQDVYFYRLSPKKSTRRRYAYYDDGKLLHTNITGKDYYHTEFFLYDDTGRLKQSIQIHSSTELNSPDWISYENYIYDDSLRTITVRDISGHRVLRKTVFQLDENYHIIGLETDYEDGSHSRATIKYDETGKKIEEADNRFEYDEKGNIVKMVSSYGDQKNISDFRYEFDGHDNWIKKVEYVKENPLQITEREIDYYQ